MVTMKRWHFYLALWCALLSGQFILPLAWKSMAQDIPISIPSTTRMMAVAAVSPSGKMLEIRVDEDGYVICHR